MIKRGDPIEIIKAVINVVSIYLAFMYFFFTLGLNPVSSSSSPTSCVFFSSQFARRIHERKKKYTDGARKKNLFTDSEKGKKKGREEEKEEYAKQLRTTKRNDVKQAKKLIEIN